MSFLLIWFSHWTYLAILPINGHVTHLVLNKRTLCYKVLISLNITDQPTPSTHQWSFQEHEISLRRHFQKTLYLSFIFYLVKIYWKQSSNVIFSHTPLPPPDTPISLGMYFKSLHLLNCIIVVPMYMLSNRFESSQFYSTLYSRYGAKSSLFYFMLNLFNIYHKPNFL